MADLKYTDTYAAGLFTGAGLHDRLRQESKTELLLTITAIRTENFNDAKQPQWVVSFGADEQELRIKPAVGKPLFEAFGNSSKGWIGKQIVLAPEWIEWTGQDGKDMEGYTLRAKPAPNNGYAATKDADSLSRQAGRNCRRPPHRQSANSTTKSRGDRPCRSTLPSALA